MATFTKYYTFVENLCNKQIDAFGATDTWNAAIHTTAPTVATDNSYTTTISGNEIGGSNGYTTGGSSIGFNSTRTTDTVTATASDVTWTASGGNLGASTTGRYFTIYDNTSSSKNLLCYFDYGATFTVATGETMTLDFGTSLFTLV